MKAVASKIDNALHNEVMQRCNNQGCSTSEYLRNLILQDVNGENDAPEKVIEREDGTYILPAGSIFRDGGVDLPDGG